MPLTASTDPLAELRGTAVHTAFSLGVSAVAFVLAYGLQHGTDTTTAAAPALLCVGVAARGAGLVAECRMHRAVARLGDTSLSLGRQVDAPHALRRIRSAIFQSAAMLLIVAVMTAHILRGDLVAGDYAFLALLPTIQALLHFLIQQTTVAPFLDARPPTAV
jgi:hypothetical protein